MSGDLPSKKSQLDLRPFGVGVLVGSKGVTSAISQGRCMKGFNTQNGE